MKRKQCKRDGRGLPTALIRNLRKFAKCTAKQARCFDDAARAADNLRQVFLDHYTDERIEQINSNKYQP